MKNNKLHERKVKIILTILLILLIFGIGIHLGLLLVRDMAIAVISFILFTLFVL